MNKIRGNNVSSIKAVADNFDIVDEKVGDVEKINLQGYDEGRDGTKSVANFIKFIWGNLGSIELSDIKVKVTTWQNSTLDKVLQKIKDWVGDLSQLKTQEKSSLVGAVNENYLKIDDVKTKSEETDRILNNQLVAINSKVTSNNSSFNTLNQYFNQLNGGN